jgi:hypothetical protein
VEPLFHAHCGGDEHRASSRNPRTYDLAMRPGEQRRAAAVGAAAVLACALAAAAVAAHGLSFRRIVIDPHPVGSVQVKAVGDLNGDGRPDIVIGGNQGVWWYAFPASGRVTGTWPRGQVATGTAYEGIAIADVDRDGRRDILVSLDGQVVWLRNPGPEATGTWQSNPIAAGVAHELLVHDLDGDGVADVVTSRTRNIDFRTGGGWTTVGWGATAPGAAADGLALLNIGSGRGAIDIVAPTSDGVYWLENPREHGGNARTDPWLAHRIGANEHDGPSLATGDLNGDGRSDVVVGAPDAQHPDGPRARIAPRSVDQPGRVAPDRRMAPRAMSAHAITVGGYVAIALAGCALAFLSHRPGSSVPRFSTVLERVARSRTGRVGVMAGWAWLGLHFFAR